MPDHEPAQFNRVKRSGDIMIDFVIRKW